MDGEIKFMNSNAARAIAAVAALVGIIYVGVLTRNAIKQYDYIGRTDDQVYTITIDGEGKVTAIPDIAEISLGLQTDKSTVSEAQRENTDKVNAIIAALKALGIDAKDIKTQNYNVYPRYDWTDGRQVLRGYAVSQSLLVKVRNLDSTGAVLEKATSLGANQVGGLSFTIDEPEALKQQAREKALAQAKEKAEALARVAGVKLGRLVSFAETTSGGYPIYTRYDAVKSAPAGAEAAAPDVEPGSQDVIVNVTVTYEVL